MDDSTIDGTLELLLRDVIHNLLSMAACEPGQPIASLVATAMRRLFFHQDILVSWRAEESRLRSSDSFTCVRATRGTFDPAMLQTFETEWSRLGDLRDRPLDAKGLYKFASSITDNIAGLRFSFCVPDAIPGTLRILIVNALHPESRKRFEHLCRYRTWQEGFATAVLALVRIALVRIVEHVAYERDVKAVIYGKDKDLVQRLQDASTLVTRVTTSPSAHRPEVIEQVLELATWSVQAMLGAGWGIRVFEASANRESIEVLHQQLETFCALLDAGSEAARELKALMAILSLGAKTSLDRDTLHGLLGQDTSEPSKIGWVWLLSVWTLMHEHADLEGSAPGSPTAQNIDELWTALLVNTRPLLARLLVESWQPAGRTPPEGAAGRGTLRNWLRLWFCGQVLLCQDGERIGRAHRYTVWNRRRHLAYVMRECVRQHLYGHRPDYRFQPAAFMTSFIHLVEMHATRVIGVHAAYDIGVHLRDIAERVARDDYHLASGHVQHVIEVYVAGHFLLSAELCELERLGVDPPSGRDTCWTVAHLLPCHTVEFPSRPVVNELRRAFSLAALFHDVGVHIVPASPRPSQDGVPWAEGVDEIEVRARRAHEETYDRLTETCLRELTQAGYLDMVGEPALRAWLDEQRRQRAPLHELFGAWHLHDRSRDVRNTSPGLLRSAVRAVLLHRAMTVPIDMGRDPVAGLLVLCDEVFDWEPLVRERTSRGLEGRSPYSMAGDMHPYRSRTQMVSIQGLTIELDTTRDDPVRIMLDAPQKPLGPDNPWPIVTVNVRPEDERDINTHAIWLSVAQNIGRLKPGKYWRPRLVMTSRLAGWRQNCRLGTWDLLAEVAERTSSPVRSYLQQWLAGAQRFHWPDDTSEPEAVHLDPLADPFWEHDIRFALVELDDLFEQVLRDHRRLARAAWR